MILSLTVFSSIYILFNPKKVALAASVAKIKNMTYLTHFQYGLWPSRNENVVKLIAIPPVATEGKVRGESEG